MSRLLLLFAILIYVPLWGDRKTDVVLDWNESDRDSPAAVPLRDVPVIHPGVITPTSSHD